MLRAILTDELGRLDAYAREPGRRNAPDEGAAGDRCGRSGPGRGLWRAPRRHRPSRRRPGSLRAARMPPRPRPLSLTKLQACQRLRDDLARNRGVPDIPALRRIADHVTAPRMAADARTAVRDIDHTGVAPIALALLRDECARAGVRIPAR